jgi:DNA polymerase-3 subunit beta
MNNRSITLDRKSLLEILSQHQNNIDKKSINPMFASIRIFTNNNLLHINSLDGERFLEHSMPFENQSFDTFLPGASLFDLLRKSNAKTIDIIEQDENNIVKIGQAEFKFAKYEHKAFPTWIDQYEHEIELDISAFCEALKTTRWAASNNEARPFLNGVCLDIKKNAVNFCASDEWRLAFTFIPTINSFEGSWIIGRKSVNDLIKLIENSIGKIQIKIGKNAIFSFKTRNESITWKTLLVAGKFPQYEKLISMESVATLSITSEEFISKLERIMITANINQPVITLFLDSSSIKITARSAISSGYDLIEGKYEGPVMKIAFNANLLNELLHNLKGACTMHIKNPHAAVLIKKDGDENTKLLLSPVTQG